MTSLRNRHFLINDIVLLPIATYLSYVLRLEVVGPASKWWPGLLMFAVTITLCTVFVFRLTGVYSRFWRYASIDELMLLTGSFTVATLTAAVIAIVTGFIVQGELWIPRSIPFILLMLGLVVTAGPRLSVRIWTRRAKRNRTPDGKVQPVLIMGAGDTGVTLARDILNNPQLGMDPIAFLDDDVHKHNVVIQGIRVVGDRFLIPSFTKKFGIQQVIIAMPTASGKEIREVVRICGDAGVKTQTMPGMPELLDDRISYSQLRDVRIDDLLRRDPITTDMAAVRKMLHGERVLITGGGGSIGGELARQVMGCDPEALILVGHGENSIFGIYNELMAIQKAAGSEHQVDLRPVIADIRSFEQMNSIMEEHCPKVIFHAAAHKHVPLMELTPAEAVLNNVGGTRPLLAAAEQCLVKRFVMVSTDKAVNPTSIMGASKRVAEKIVYDAAVRTGLAFVTVRFGNVLGSRGSVVPIFQQQIADGGPVTVTHRDVKRYFMTIPEAVQLVLQASVLGNGGELFMLDMGEPVRIVDLAEDLIRLSGLELGTDIDIEYTGLRPGDKLFEEMFMSNEEYTRTEYEQIYIAKNGQNQENPSLQMAVDALLQEAQINDNSAVLDSLQALVPEYDPILQIGSEEGESQTGESSVHVSLSESHTGQDVAYEAATSANRGASATQSTQATN